MSAEQIVLAAGFKIVTWPEFQAATDVPAHMRKIADGVHDRWGGDFVVYDPAGGDDGWLLVDDDRDQIIGETVEHLGRQPSFLEKYAGPHVEMSCSGCRCTFKIPQSWLPYVCDECSTPCEQVEPQPAAAAPAQGSLF